MTLADGESQHRAAGPRFATTQWSVVLAAGGTDATAAAPALERLCRAYWYPLWAFCRRKGHTPDDASDLTQAFFLRLLERNFLGLANPERGRFRTFLLTALERFLISEWVRGQREKRGGGRRFFSLDAEKAEARYQLERADHLTPERLFERRWVFTLLERAVDLLREECSRSGRESLFEAAKSSLTAGGGDLDHEEIAARLGMSRGAVKTAMHRLRRRYGEILRAEIAETVGDPADVDDEVRHLFAVLAGSHP